MFHLFLINIAKKHTGILQNFIGGLGSYIYDFDSYYFRIDGAVSHIKERFEEATTFSGTEIDDILFTFGKKILNNNKNALTMSGLLGIPTHRIFRLQHVDFGYSQVGTGFQFDGSYDINTTTNFIYGARYIHFVPRKVLDALNQSHTFTIGNIADILLAYKKNWNDRGIECGYTVRSRFGAHTTPNLDNTVKKTNYVRSNFYTAAKYKIVNEDISHRFIFYLAYGFDHSPKIYGNQYIVTVWGSWTVGF